MPGLETQTRFEAGFDIRAWSATDIVKPGVALIDRRRYLGILLAKNMEVQREGTLLTAVRWMRLPLGWRLPIMHALSQAISMRLPDEWLFNEIFLTLAPNGMFVARLDREAACGVVLPTPAEWPYPTRELSAGQYRLLSEASGRLLQAQIATMFRDWLGSDGERARLHHDPAWPNGPLPWTVFAG